MCSHTSKNIHPTVLRGLAEIDISNGDYKAAALKLDAALLRLDLATDRTPEETLLLPQLIVAGVLGDWVTYETMIERLRDSGVPPYTLSKHIFSEIHKGSHLLEAAQQ